MRAAALKTLADNRLVCQGFFVSGLTYAALMRGVGKPAVLATYAGEEAQWNSPPQQLGEQFPPLTAHEAFVESNRCLYCYDAPCTQACPTHIDIPAFIKKISTGNLTGSARTILESNADGNADVARASGPVQELCEERSMRTERRTQANHDRASAASCNGFCV